ncbi:unnamed protein product [Candidula unifasciata]|uniref:peptidylprolyl isomerase n=1 Tax=Candidula unifasciata TaxID=100452 RepID=A0A8S4A1G8_9EUPU|nr:unnamed protein product [Candidula unifasciata]
MNFRCIVMLFAIFLVATVTVADDGEEEGTNSQGEEESAVDDEVTIEIITPPPEDCQRKSKRYDQLYMHYVATLTESGKKFDASYDRDKPFDFQLGAGQVIKGWDEGLFDMCVGEKRKLVIPPSKGYGKTGAGDRVPPNASLTFEVELLSIKDGVPPPNIFKQIDADDDNLLSAEEVSDYLKKQASKAGQRQEDKDNHNQMITEIFNHEDKDKDGFISHEEFTGPKHEEL